MWSFVVEVGPRPCRDAETPCPRGGMLGGPQPQGGMEVTTPGGDVRGQPFPGSLQSAQHQHVGLEAPRSPINVCLGPGLGTDCNGARLEFIRPFAPVLLPLELVCACASVQCFVVGVLVNPQHGAGLQ